MLESRENQVISKNVLSQGREKNACSTCGKVCKDIRFFHLLQLAIGCSNVVCASESAEEKQGCLVICQHISVHMARQCRNHNRWEEAETITHTHTHIYIYIYIYMCVCVCVYALAHLPCMYVEIKNRYNICTQTHIYAYIYLYTNLLSTNQIWYKVNFQVELNFSPEPVTIPR